MKTILAIETSSPVLSVALKTGKQKITEYSVEGFARHTENLIPLIDRLLKKEKLSVRDIDIFLVSRGPGSFTGLRVGFSTLKGFLARRKKPCYGALSLDMIASGIDLEERSWLGVLLDAHREKVYARFYRRENGRWRPKAKACTLNLSEIAAKLPASGTLTGDALGRYAVPLKELLARTAAKKKVTWLASENWYPKASALIKVFEKQTAAKTAPKRDLRLEKMEKPEDFIPVYLRRSEAEERRKSHGASH